MGSTTLQAATLSTAVNIPNPLKPGAVSFRSRGYWFESTAYGGRAHPYEVALPSKGTINQTLAILSTCDLPLNHPIVVNNSQRPGVPKTITMEDMLKHAQKTVAYGNRTNSPGRCGSSRTTSIPRPSGRICMAEPGVWNSSCTAR